MIVSLQMHSKGQNCHIPTPSKEKGGSNSTFHDRSKQRSCICPRKAPIEDVKATRETAKLHHSRTLFSEGFALAIMRSLVYFLVPGPQTLPGSLFIIIFAV